MAFYEQIWCRSLLLERKKFSVVSGCGFGMEWFASLQMHGRITINQLENRLPQLRILANRVVVGTHGRIECDLCICGSQGGWGYPCTAISQNRNSGRRGDLVTPQGGQPGGWTPSGPAGPLRSYVKG